MSRHVYAAVKKCVLSLLRKVDKECRSAAISGSTVLTVVYFISFIQLLVIFLLISFDAILVILMCVVVVNSEFFYIQMEKSARQVLSEGVKNVSELVVSKDDELYRVLVLHYNRNNQIEASYTDLCIKIIIIEKQLPFNACLLRSPTEQIVTKFGSGDVGLINCD